MKFTIAFLTIFLLCSCTTINFADSKGMKVYKSPSTFRGYTDEGPPSSLNPLLEVVSKDNKQSLIGFSMGLAKKIKWHKKANHIVIRLEIIFYPYDGLNWKMGDINEAVIYYMEAETLLDIGAELYRMVMGIYFLSGE